MFEKFRYVGKNIDMLGKQDKLGKAKKCWTNRRIVAKTMGLQQPPKYDNFGSFYS